MLRTKACIAIAVLNSCLAGHWSDAVRAQGFELRIEAPPGVPPGTQFEVELLGRSLVPLIGYSASVRYDSVLTLRSVSVEGTPWESADVVFVDEQPAAGTVSIGVIVDADGVGVTRVDALSSTTFARLGFTTTEAAVATIGFADDSDFNLLIDVDLNGYDSFTGLRLVEDQVVVGGEEGAAFVRADCNGDVKVDVSDPIFLLTYLFLGGPLGDCPDGCDANDTGDIDVSDPIWTLSFMFLGKSPPPPPFPEPGLDPTADILFCPVP